MAVKIIDNLPKIKAEKSAKVPVMLRLLVEGVYNTANPRTPKDTGRLRQDVKRQVLGKKGRIEWTKHYAIYQENKQYRNYTTPGTGPHFAENSVKQEVAKSMEYAKKAGLI